VSKNIVRLGSGAEIKIFATAEIELLLRDKVRGCPAGLPLPGRLGQIVHLVDVGWGQHG
jgi:hypothetical protein